MVQRQATFLYIRVLIHRRFRIALFLHVYRTSNEYFFIDNADSERVLLASNAPMCWVLAAETKIAAMNATRVLHPRCFFHNKKKKKNSNTKWPVHHFSISCVNFIHHPTAPGAFQVGLYIAVLYCPVFSVSPKRAHFRWDNFLNFSKSEPFVLITRSRLFSYSWGHRCRRLDLQLRFLAAVPRIHISQAFLQYIQVAVHSYQLLLQYGGLRALSLLLSTADVIKHILSSLEGRLVPVLEGLPFLEFGCNLPAQQ